MTRYKTLPLDNPELSSTLLGSGPDGESENYSVESIAKLVEANVDEVGLTAYQVAVFNGFEGTEAEWLQSLQGPAGPQGAQGPKGEPSEGGLDPRNVGGIYLQLNIDWSTVTPSNIIAKIYDAINAHPLRIIPPRNEIRVYTRRVFQDGPNSFTTEIRYYHITFKLNPESDGRIRLGVGADFQFDINIPTSLLRRYEIHTRRVVDNVTVDRGDNGISINLTATGSTPINEAWNASDNEVVKDIIIVRFTNDDGVKVYSYNGDGETQITLISDWVLLENGNPSLDPAPESTDDCIKKGRRVLTSQELQTLFSVGSIELQPAVSGKFYEVLSATIKYEPNGNPYNTGFPLFITNFTTDLNDSQFRAVGGSFLAEPTERWQKLFNPSQPNEGVAPIVGLPLNVSCPNNLGNGGGTVTVYYSYVLLNE